MSLLLEVFKVYYPKLVRLLPMNDECFMSDLYGKSLLPGDLKADIESLPTSTKRASKFLDNVIKPSVENNDSRKLHILLNLMKENDDISIKELADKIRISLDGTIKCMMNLTLPNDETGKFCRLYMLNVFYSFVYSD